MTIEVERKFVVVDVPDLRVATGRRLRQGYLAQERNVEVRVRVVDDAEAWLTVKAGRGLVRTEVELPLQLEQAEALWVFTEGRRLTKRRYDVPLGKAEASIDVYDGELAGLVVAEVEFGSEAAAEAFLPPPWFDREVTGQAGWDNASLARNGLPPDGPAADP